MRSPLPSRFPAKAAPAHGVVLEDALICSRRSFHCFRFFTGLPLSSVITSGIPAVRQWIHSRQIRHRCLDRGQGNLLRIRPVGNCRLQRSVTRIRRLSCKRPKVSRSGIGIASLFSKMRKKSPPSTVLPPWSRHATVLALAVKHHAIANIRSERQSARCRNSSEPHARSLAQASCSFPAIPSCTGIRCNCSLVGQEMEAAFSAPASSASAPRRFP